MLTSLTKAFQCFTDKWSQSYSVDVFGNTCKKKKANSVETATEAEMLSSWREYSQLEIRMTPFRPFRTARPPCVEIQV